MPLPPPIDPRHWLFRFSVDEWLRAAEQELSLCREALQRRAIRTGVTHARRAAGMAWNAILVIDFDPRYGRSYMEHVVALADEPGIPEPVRTAALRLQNATTTPPIVLQIGKPDVSAYDAAATVVTFARTRIGAAQNLTTN
jgi:HEPN domain-containing protein